MPGSVWVWVAVAVVLGALRWTLADIVLDQFGWLTDWLRGKEQREDSAGG